MSEFETNKKGNLEIHFLIMHYNCTSVMAGFLSDLNRHSALNINSISFCYMYIELRVESS